jgi:dihydroneopterin aldolase
MDRVVIKGAKFQAHVGTGEEERNRPQGIEIDVVLWLDTRKAGTSDNYEHTVCYTQVHEYIATAVASTKFALIEAIAESAAASILSAFPVKRVRVTVKKPGALQARAVRYCAVRITRRRGE